MPQHEVELSVGETIRIGDYCLTVIDIEGEEIAFRIDAADAVSLEEIGNSVLMRPAK